MLKKVLRIKLKIIVIVMLVLVLVQLVTAYIFGYITQTQMELQFKDLTTNPLVKVDAHTYHRGLFSSDASTELSLNSKLVGSVLNLLPKNNAESMVPSTTNMYHIKYTTHIEHGMFSGILNGYFVPTLAYARTNIIYPDKLKSLLDKFFDKRPPLIIENLIYVDKSGRYEAYSPGFNYDEAVSGVKVIWGGMDMVVKYNDDFTSFKKKLNLPLFELSTPTKGTASLSNLVYQSDTRINPDKITVGITTLHLGGLKVEWKDRIDLGFKVGDLFHTLTGISSAEFLNGIDAIDPNSFAFNNLSYQTSSHDIDNFFAATALVHLDSLITNSKSYGPLDLDLSFDHVSSPEFAQIIDKLEDISSNPAQGADQAKVNAELVQTLKQYFGPILVNKPVFKLNRFSVKTPDGLVQISGNATTNNFTLADMSDQNKFMHKLVVDINLAVPRPVLSYLLVLQMRYLLSAGNAQMDQESSDALTKVVNILLDNQINIWSKKGYVTSNNGILATHLAIKGGVIYLNDKASE